MRVIFSQCDACRHVDRTAKGAARTTCKAFPDGIPPAIFGYIKPGEPVPDHREPYPGDNGVRFEPLPGKRHPLVLVEENRRKAEDH